MGQVRLGATEVDILPPHCYLNGLTNLLKYMYFRKSFTDRVTLGKYPPYPTTLRTPQNKIK